MHMGGSKARYIIGILGLYKTYKKEAPDLSLFTLLEEGLQNVLYNYFLFDILLNLNEVKLS